MRISRRAAACIALLVAAAGGACNIGTRAADFGPAKSAEGATVAIHVRNQPQVRTGELLAVDSIGVFLYDADLFRIPWSRLQAMDVRGLATQYGISFDEKVSSAKRERLAILSRFPGGLSGALLQDVLRKIGRDAVIDIR